MNLFVEHDAAVLARISGADKPACDSVIIRHGDPRDVLASVVRANPLGEGWLADLDAPSPCILAWSGTLAADLMEADPRTWLTPGKQALARFCDELAPQLRTHGRSLCFQPHARHVLNDGPSCLKFLRDRASQPFEIALAPASMLEPSMLDRLDEHLQRLFEYLGASCAMIILNDVRVIVESDGESRCEVAALGTGGLPRDIVRNLIHDCVPRQTPIVIDGRAGGDLLARQIDWLTG